MLDSSTEDTNEPWLKFNRPVVYWSVTLVFLGFCLTTGSGLGLLIGFSGQLPSLAPLEDYTSDEWNLPTKVYDREGTLIAEFYQEQRELVSLEELPPELIHAIIAIEDRRFTRHNGIDFQGIFRAAIRNLQAGRIVEGGSTLTQQLAKVLFLTPKQTFKRKFEEALLALRIERHYTKKEILERYFNKVYFGAGAYGIQAASELYFGIDARDLNLPQAALLASLPRAPSYYSPLNDPDRVKDRHRHVLSLLAERDWLEPDEVDEVFETFWEQYDPERHREDFRQVRVHDSRYFVEEVRRRLVNRYGEERVYQGGLTVHTTLDREQQSLLEDEMHDYLLEVNIAQDVLPDTATSFDRYRDENRVEGSAYLKDPTTGEVRAVVGGHGWHTDNQINRATQTRRQPGSAFKPILYATALEEGFTLSDTLLDMPLVHDTPQGPWIPRNYTGTFRGEVTIRNALVDSLNVATVKLMDRVGSERVLDMARNLGIESPMSPNLAMALGGLEHGVTLAELTDAYGVFAAQGVRTNSYLIREIRDREGNLLEQNFAYREEVLSPQVAYLMNHTLQRVVEEGTGRSIGRAVNIPLAGKTGTTNEFRDAWFLGYTPDLVMGTWFGYDRERLSMGEGMSGGVVAGRFWRRVAPDLFDSDPSPYRVPNGVHYVRINPNTGLRASDECEEIRREPFIIGTEPTRRCGEPERLETAIR